MNKYRVCFLPTKRSRKMKTFFVYANTDAKAILNAKDEMKRLYYDNEIISIQRPDHGFIDLKKSSIIQAGKI